jgi:hypothetical protein
MPNLLADNQPTRRSAPPRPPRAAPPRPQPRPSRVLSGVSAALLAAVIGLLMVEAVALVVWMAEPRSSAPLSDALRTGAAFWLLGHGGRLSLPAGTAGLIPLGLSAIFASLAARAGASVSRVRPSRSRRRGILAAGLAVAVPYGLVAAVVAGVASSGGLHVSALTAGNGAFVLALIGAVIGAGRELPIAAPKPTRARALLAGVVVAGGVLVAGAALLAAIVLVFHISDAAALAKPAKAGAVGGVGLLAIQAALAPNVITWSASYLLGPGFAIGAGTLVSPGHTRLGDVPAVPILAALPGHAAPWPLYVLFLIPIGAGVLGGLTVVRRLPKAPNLAGSALLGAGVGVGVAVPLALAAMLSGGPVTAGRLATVGPAALPVGLMALLEIGLPSVLAALAFTWRREQQRRLDPASATARDVTVSERIKDRLRGLSRDLSDWRGLVRGIRQAPAAAGHGVVTGLRWLVGLPGLGVHWLFHGSTPRPARVNRRTVLAESESGKVNLVKAPHDPYELFRDELDEPDHVIDLTDAAVEADAEADAEADVDDWDDPEELADVDQEPNDFADAAPVAEGKRRRPHLPQRLRRKPKVIKLPD